MATIVAAFTPTAGGTTAINRLARRRPSDTQPATTAQAVLGRTQFRLLQIVRIENAGTARLRDLASGETVRVDDEAGVEVAMGFVRPGRSGLINPLRCADAVYRHMLRHGTPRVPGLNEPSPGEYDELAEAGDGLDQLALQWAEPRYRRDPDAVQFVCAETSSSASSQWSRQPPTHAIMACSPCLKLTRPWPSCRWMCCNAGPLWAPARFGFRLWRRLRSRASPPVIFHPLRGISLWPCDDD